MSKEVCFISLGCPKNLVDTEIVIKQFEEKGYVIGQDIRTADIIVINTCAFIQSARDEAIENILEAGQLRKDENVIIVVMGCMAQLYGEIIREEMPDVNYVFGMGSYEDIVESIENNSESKVKINDPDDCKIDYLDGERELSTSSYAYLKIAEGCSNRCTFCIIPYLKGNFRSRPFENIVEEARQIAAKGVKEIILVAQDTTKYGIDLYGKKRLHELMNEISLIDGIKMIRVLYTYPDEIYDELLDTIANNDTICKYLDMPIQHISDAVLKKMGRRGGSKLIRDTIKKIKEKIPGVVLRTSIICGFPGETKEDFEELLSFIDEGNFDRLGAFPYSKEKGSPAAKLKDQIPKRTKEQRAAQVMKHQKSVTCLKNNERIGKIYSVITEDVADDGIFYTGRSYGEAPDIDDKIYYVSPEPLQAGDIVNVKIEVAREYELIGTVV